MTRLVDLKPGQKGTITGWNSESPPARLLEFGLLPGTEVELVRFAPLGDPIDIRIRGFHLSIRISEAKLILLDHVHSD